MFSKKVLYDQNRAEIERIDVPKYLKSIVEVKEHSIETSLRIYPRNTPEILINLEDPIHAEMRDKTPVVKKVTIQGSKTDYADVYHPNKCHFISIRFDTNGYYKILGIPQKSFSNRFPDFSDVIDYDIDAIIEKINYEKSREGRLKILCEWLREDVGKEGGSPELLSDVVMSRLQQNPRLSVAQLAEQTGYTRKHLAHQFKEEAGLTIKEYQKINRLQRVLKSVSAREDVHWARVACEHGFYDQSHLIRDVKRYTGYTPTDLVNPREHEKA